MPTVIYDGTCPGADTTPGAPGNTTSIADVAAVGTAGGWTDEDGVALVSGHAFAVLYSGAPTVPHRIIQTANLPTLDQGLVVTVGSADLVGACQFQLRTQSDGKGYVANVTAANQCFVRVGDGSGSLPIYGTFDGGAPRPLELTFRATGSNPTTLSVDLRDADGVSLFSQSVDESTAEYQLNGTVAMSYGLGDAGGAARSLATRIRITNESVGALFQADPEAVNGAISVSLSWPDATGGTVPYTYRVHRSSIADAPPGAGDVLSSYASGTTYTDTPPDSGVYFYAVEAQDSTSATAASGWAPGTLLNAPINVVLIGDSITDNGSGDRETARTDATTDAAELELIGALRVVTGPRAWSLYNVGWAGATTADWLPTASTVGGLMVDGSPANRYALARKAVTGSATGTVARPGTVAFVRLGTNDGAGQSIPGDGATYQAAAETAAANVGTLAAALAGLGAVVIICDIPYSVSPAIPRFWEFYRPALDALEDGAAIRRDVGDYRIFAAEPGLLADGTHPTSTGRRVLAAGWAATLAGTATYAAAADVRSGTDRGDGTPGTLAVPTADQVLAGVSVDATTGNVVLPTTSQVQSGVAFGPAGVMTGTYAPTNATTQDPYIIRTLRSEVAQRAVIQATDRAESRGRELSRGVDVPLTREGLSRLDRSVVSKEKEIEHDSETNMQADRF